ncbi:hypothetical protein Hte_009663 [Hypoxylon texense]
MSRWRKRSQEKRQALLADVGGAVKAHIRQQHVELVGTHFQCQWEDGEGDDNAYPGATIVVGGGAKININGGAAVDVNAGFNVHIKPDRNAYVYPGATVNFQPPTSMPSARTRTVAEPALRLAAVAQAYSSVSGAQASNATRLGRVSFLCPFQGPSGRLYDKCRTGNTVRRRCVTRCPASRALIAAQ